MKLNQSHFACENILGMWHCSVLLLTSKYLCILQPIFPYVILTVHQWTTVPLQRLSLHYLYIFTTFIPFVAISPHIWTFSAFSSLLKCFSLSKIWSISIVRQQAVLQPLLLFLLPLSVEVMIFQSQLSMAFQAQGDCLHFRSSTLAECKSWHYLYLLLGRGSLVLFQLKMKYHYLSATASKTSLPCKLVRLSTSQSSMHACKPSLVQARYSYPPQI